MAAPGCFGPDSSSRVTPLRAPHPQLTRPAPTRATAHQSQPLPPAVPWAQVSKGRPNLLLLKTADSAENENWGKKKKRSGGDNDMKLV